MDEMLERVVYSRAGHDKGKCFAVVGIADDAHVLIADGKSRRVTKPKRKKLKHLQFEKRKIAGLLEKINAKGGTADAYLRKALSAGCEDGRDKEE